LVLLSQNTATYIKNASMQKLDCSVGFYETRHFFAPKIDKNCTNYIAIIITLDPRQDSFLTPMTFEISTTHGARQNGVQRTEADFGKGSFLGL
jgi:hypothetical protein